MHARTWRTVEREEADIHISFHLPAVLAQAGLAVAQIRTEVVVQTPDSQYPTAVIIHAMLPRIVQYGVATEEDLGMDTLD